MSPVHSGGCSLGEPLTLLKRWPWRLGSRVFSAKATFPFLHSLVGGRPSTNEDVFTWIGLREIKWRRLCSVPMSLLLGHWVAKDFYFGSFLGSFCPQPQL